MSSPKLYAFFCAEECKKNEDKIFQQMQKIAALNRDVKKSNDEIDSIINDFKNRKK